MTGQHTIDLLEKQDSLDTPVGLERIHLLLEKLGHPEQHLKFVLLGGTNGKGSVSAMLYAIFNRCEYKAGLFTSPHLYSVHERIQVDGKVIDNDALGIHGEPVFQAANEMVAEGHTFPTQLELCLAIGLLHFVAERTDVVLMEVGQGGYLDPTTAIGVPLLTVLTNIDHQHHDAPEKTLKEYVENLAGIIKSGTSVVVYEQSTEVMDIIADICKEKSVPMKISSGNHIKLISQTPTGQTLLMDGKTIQLPLTGDHQRRNMALTLDAVSLLKSNNFGFSSAGVLAGFSRTMWPGRFERVLISPDFILDGCCNLQSVDAVMTTLQEIYPNKSIVFLVGMLDDKEYGTMLHKALPLAKHFVTVPPQHPRALSSEILAKYLRTETTCPVVAADTVAEGVEMVMEIAESDDVICGFGSLHIVGDIRYALGLC